MRIVTFHTIDDRWARERHPLGGYKAPWTELIPFFAQSVRLRSPNATLELLTDNETNAHVELFDRVWRSKVQPERLMLDRFRAQHTLLSTAKEGEFVAFLDTDTLVQRPLHEVFGAGFDVGITIRDNPVHIIEYVMPYNNGVIFVRAGSRALEYFDRLIEELERLQPETWAWMGGQSVVRDLVGIHAPGAELNIVGVRVRVLPCSIYNYTPAGPNEECNRQFILHFPGNAKPLMEGYARKLLEWT